MNAIINDNNMISMLAHEVKNPLCICNGYLSMIDDIDIETNNYLKIIKEEINRSLMILSEFSKNNYSNEIIDLNTLYNDLYRTLNKLFEKNNSKLVFLDNDHLYIKGNYNRLKQAFINILKNSIESKDKDNLLVVVKTLEGKDNYIITITDNGCGMDMYELKNFNKQYYTTKVDGTGLGMPYINKVIEELSGRIEYSSKKGKGTKVKIIIPKEKSHKTFNNSSYN